MADRDPAVHLRHAFVRDGRLIALPRLLVDHGFLGRRASVYWRERPIPSIGREGA
jgi:hypothetical protein